MGNKEIALFKIFGSGGKDISEINASCGLCNKTYQGGELIEQEEQLNNEFYKYRLVLKCPEGHTVLGADV